MKYRIDHGAETDSTAVSSSAAETAESQQQARRIAALEHAVENLKQQLAGLTIPHAVAPAKASPPTLPQIIPHQGCPAKAPPLALSATALAAAVPGQEAASPPMKAPPVSLLARTAPAQATAVPVRGAASPPLKAPPMTKDERR